MQSRDIATPPSISHKPTIGNVCHTHRVVPRGTTVAVSSHVMDAFARRRQVRTDGRAGQNTVLDTLLRVLFFLITARPRASPAGRVWRAVSDRTGGLARGRDAVVDPAGPRSRRRAITLSYSAYGYSRVPCIGVT